MSSFLSQIARYRPRADRFSREDFFTEAFAGVLRSSYSLRVAFVRWLTSHDVDAVSLETQKTVPGGDRLDVRIDARNERSGARHVVAMENKIGAPEGEDQLLRYALHLKHDEPSADTRTLVYATRHERTTFLPPANGPEVKFRPIHWFEVADWMRKWAAEPSHDAGDRGFVFVHELLLPLMEDWNMAMNLTPADLVVAAQYHTSVGAQLLQILDATKEACGLAGTRGNAWSYNQQELVYISPWVDDQKNLHVEFGFDFDRDDADWSGPQLSLPSAYFAAMGTDETARPELERLRNWGSAPTAWPDGYLRVKSLGSLHVQGNSLHGEYLRFFQTARDELWRVLGL